MASRRVGLCSVVSAMCDASQCTTIRKPLGVFTELRRCAVAPVPFVPLVTHLRAYNEAKRELREGGREGEKKRRTDGRKSFIECGRTAFGVAKHNYLGNVAYSSIFRVSSSWTVRSYNSPWHRTEVGDLLQWRVRANRSRRGEVSDRAVPRLLTTPNRFRFEHDSYIKG